MGITKRGEIMEKRGESMKRKVEVGGDIMHDLERLCELKDINIEEIIDDLDDEKFFELFGDIDEEVREDIISMTGLDVMFYTGDGPYPENFWYTGSFYIEVDEDKAEDLVRDLNRIPGVTAYVKEVRK